MKAENVVSSAWKDVDIIFENDEWSAIWGTYLGRKHVGIRWNGDTSDSLGFPVVYAHATWFTLPDDLVFDVLHILLAKALSVSDVEKISTLQKAISECINELSSE